MTETTMPDTPGDADGEPGPDQVISVLQANCRNLGAENQRLRDTARELLDEFAPTGHGHRVAVISDEHSQRLEARLGSRPTDVDGYEDDLILTAVAYERDRLEERADRLQGACVTLGRTVEHQARMIYAAGIDVALSDFRAAAQWVLNATPDVDDNDPDDQWNGTETGAQWFERTRDTAGQQVKL